MTQPSIEQLILAHGSRGIERLAPYLPVDYAARAARALWGCRHVLITTGFYVGGHAETDGPPGALFLGRVLAEQGASVSYVGEPYVLELLKAMVEELVPSESFGSASLPLDRLNFIEFPVTDVESSKSLAAEIISNRFGYIERDGEGFRRAIVAIERCGRTRSDRYRNMLGTDISRWTARVDDLFAYQGPTITTVGVGDGGNEIGMGLLAEHISAELGITDPVETRVDHLVLATVSNWGAYGIVAYLSRLAGRDLLPKDGEEAKALEVMVACGAIDGLTHEAGPTVDGFSLDASSALISALRREAQ
jgi:hypothetical protein